MFSLERLAQGVADGIGPVVVGALIVAFGRRDAFQLSLLCLALAWLLSFWLMRSYPRDARAVAAALDARAHAASESGQRHRSPARAPAAPTLRAF